MAVVPGPSGSGSVSSGTGSGSGSLGGEFVLVDEDANAHSNPHHGNGGGNSTSSARDRQPSPTTTQQQQRPSGSQQSSSNRSSPSIIPLIDLLDSAVQSRLADRTKQASQISKTADSRVEGMRTWLAIEASSINTSTTNDTTSTSKHEIAARVLDELQRMNEENGVTSDVSNHHSTIRFRPSGESMLTSSMGGFGGLCSPEEYLVAALGLYLRALEILQFAQQSIDASMQHTLDGLSTRESAARDDVERSSIHQQREQVLSVQAWVRHRYNFVWQKCLMCRRAIEEMAVIAAAPSNSTVGASTAPPNTVRIGGALAPSAAASRRGSMSASSSVSHSPMLHAAASDEQHHHEESKESNGTSSMLQRSPHTSPNPPSQSLPSLLSTLQTPSVEKQLFDESLSKCQDGVQCQLLGQWKLSVHHYRSALQLIDAILTKPSHATNKQEAADVLTQADRETLNKLQQFIQIQMKGVEQKAAAMTDEARRMNTMSTSTQSSSVITQQQGMQAQQQQQQQQQQQGNLQPPEQVRVN